MPAKKILIYIAILFLSLPAFADTIALNPDHPDRHVVVKGDTLWDISARFLRDPWRWPDVWRNNPQIENPHLIYPGDVIALTYRPNGQPELMLERGPGVPENVVKLSPQTRKTPLVGAAIPTIPYDLVEQFLTRTRILSQRELDSSGYIVATEEYRLIAGSNNKVYARGINPGTDNRFLIFRVGETYFNEGDDIPLGYEAMYVGEATLQVLDDPATFLVTSAKREVLKGDRLLPLGSEEITREFIPHSPEFPINGQIISVVDGVSRIGQYHIVVINKGETDNIEIGHVLAINQKGDVIRDSIGPNGGKVTLPRERAGLAMVFRVFENVSYALVMKAYREMRIYDLANTP